jgi:hypothetical protein
MLDISHWRLFSGFESGPVAAETCHAQSESSPNVLWGVLAFIKPDRHNNNIDICIKIIFKNA